eukprot:gene12930-14262_t
MDEENEWKKIFCSQCGAKIKTVTTARYCSSCGKEITTASSPVSLSNLASTPTAPAPRVRSFSEFKKAKGTQWKTLVTKKKSDKDADGKDVQINIGLIEWSDMAMKLKVKRGKKMMLAVSNTAPYFEIKEKALAKWSAFHSDVFEDTEEYILLLSNFEKAQFLPGAKAEFFTLKRYKEELGRDYNKITLFLCKQRDHNEYLHIESDSGDELSDPAPKMQKFENYFHQDDQQQEVFASISSNFGQPLNPINISDYGDMWLNNAAGSSAAISSTAAINDVATEDQGTQDMIAGVNIKNSTNIIAPKATNTLEEVIKGFENEVKSNSGHFFLVIRRSSPLSRVLSMWKREAAKVSPAKLLRVKFLGENGIDTGALSKEFLATTISQIGSKMFPNGAPIDSMSNVANGLFQACGEIVAVSLAQGGPAPVFLDENAYALMLSEGIADAGIDKFLSEFDNRMFSTIRENVEQHEDLIIDHGYTGIIEDKKKDEIIATKVSVINRRSLYLKEFSRGLSLFGIYDALRDHPDLLKKLFVLQRDADKVDSMYLASVLSPVFSSQDPDKLHKEEIVLDNLQDCIFNFEDNLVSGYSEPLAYKDEDPHAQTESEEKFHNAKLTPAGVLGWLTGQQHKPLNGESLQITVRFDHDCMERNPQHRVVSQ